MNCPGVIEVVIRSRYRFWRIDVSCYYIKIKFYTFSNLVILNHKRKSLFKIREKKVSARIKMK